MILSHTIFICYLYTSSHLKTPMVDLANFRHGWARLSTTNLYWWLSPWNILTNSFQRSWSLKNCAIWLDETIISLYLEIMCIGCRLLFHLKSINLSFQTISKLAIPSRPTKCTHDNSRQAGWSLPLLATPNKMYGLKKIYAQNSRHCFILSKDNDKKILKCGWTGDFFGLLTEIQCSMSSNKHLFYLKLINL